MYTHQIALRLFCNPSADKCTREDAAEKGSNDTEEMVTVLTSLDAATVLSSGVAKVLTGSELVYVEALQVKHLIIDREVHTEGERSYWKITRLGGSSVSHQFFVDLLKHFDREDLNQLWALVKESLSIRPATIEWKLYDTCGVHHVIFKDQETFMLAEKYYPLRKGLALVMICYKLQINILFWKLDYRWSIKFREGLLGINAQGIPTASDKFPLPEEVPTASEESSPC
nr:hypothetical protein [Tanacetum cinerariifolium]